MLQFSHCQNSSMQLIPKLSFLAYFSVNIFLLCATISLFMCNQIGYAHSKTQENLVNWIFLPQKPSLLSLWLQYFIGGDAVWFIWCFFNNDWMWFVGKEIAQSSKSVWIAKDLPVVLWINMERIKFGYYILLLCQFSLNSYFWKLSQF